MKPFVFIMIIVFIIPIISYYIGIEESDDNYRTFKYQSHNNTYSDSNLV